MNSEMAEPDSLLDLLGVDALAVYVWPEPNRYGVGVHLLGGSLPTEPGLVVVARGRTPFMVDARRLEDTGAMTLFAAAFAEVRRDAGDIWGTVGLEGAGVNEQVAVRALCAEAHRDLGHEIDVRRRVLSPGAVEAMRAGADLSAGVIGEVVAGVSGEHRSERNWVRDATSRLVRHGVRVSLVYAGGPAPMFVPRSTVMAAGEITSLCVEIADDDGLWTETSRLFSVGTPDLEMTRAAEVCRRAIDEGMAALRPGVAIRAVAKRMSAVLERTGRPGFGSLGHGIGIDGVPPNLVVDSDEFVVEGSAFALHPTVVLPGGRALLLAESIAVGADGACPLRSDFDRDPLVELL